MLPQDPMILVSYVNTQLRDKYASLSELCDHEDVDEEELVKKLAQISYKYNAELNKFV